MCDQKFDYKDDQLTYWAKRVSFLYPKLSTRVFMEIVQLGTDGKWKGKYEGHTTFSVLIGWIEKFKEEKTAEAEKIKAEKAESARKEWEADRIEAFEKNIDLDTFLRLKAKYKKAEHENQ